MSHYFHALERLRGAAPQTGSPQTGSPKTGSPQTGSPQTGSPQITFSRPANRRQAVAAARGEIAYGDLLDSLRTVDGEGRVPTVIVASISARESARPVIAGLAQQAERRGVRLFLGELGQLDDGRTLHRHALTAGDAGDDVDELEISGPPVAAELRAWFERATATGYDLAVIEAPPLLASVDAALLARACDGLVLVVRPQSTPRDAFEAAVERARAAGCRLLGLVMDGSRPWLPRFLSRLFPGYPRAIRPRSRV